MHPQKRVSMRMPRIYINQNLAVGAIADLPKEAEHYVRQVLRLREGTPVVLFNGLGGEYRGEIRLNNKQVSVSVEEFIDHSVESPLKIHLGQGISRGEKMDYVVQKAVELGVAEITPLFTERCGVKLIEERAQKRLDHWKKIIHSACEPSGRTIIPQINPPVSMAEWIGQREETARFICHPGLPSKLDDSQTLTSIALLVGAEGGFTDEEVTHAMDHEFKPLLLGPRILRTETAAVAALSKLQVCWGDL
jgi:16S rRNA (uracil1498-N3)-methyltransferase